jgi:4-amino-4-deoxy-L-arabinose transferase-like glycosyltransferase
MSAHISIETTAASPQISSPQSNFLIALLLIMIAVFYASTLRAGHIWGDDFAMYIHHAENIVEGKPYANTGYIFNPAAPVSPRMYPPIFPLLLTPVYKLYGANLMPMKLEQVFFFVLALTFVYIFWKRDLGPAYSVALVAILGFNPIFWAAKDNVLSDLPFLLFFYMAAAIVQWSDSSADKRWAVFVGVALYLAIGTRSAGVALIGGLVLYDLLRIRRIKHTSVAVAVCAGFLMLQSWWVGSGLRNYDGHFHPTLHTVEMNLISYPRSLAGFWVASTRNGFSFVFLLLVVLLTVGGAYFRYKRGLTVIEAFLAPYVVIVLLWPFSPGIRLVFPVVPWIVFLALYGLRNLTQRLVPRYSTAAIYGFLCLIAVPYLLAYHKADFGPIRESTGSPEFNSFSEMVRERTAPGDVLIYYRARALALYTGRKASSYNSNGTEQELQRWAGSIHARYLIATDAFAEDHGFLARYVEHHSFDLELIYQNAHFKLYRILPSS